MSSRTVGGLKIALVGAVTRDTPKVIMFPKSIVGLRFADEADTLNALVPELRGRRCAGAGGHHARRRHV
jgi:5'-nucleotidase